MDAREQAKYGALLDMGLAHCGLEVVEPVREGAQIVGYQPVTGTRLVATLLVRGLVTRLREPTETRTGPAGRADAPTMLRLMRPEKA